jgi:hypothetical protein
VTQLSRSPVSPAWAQASAPLATQSRNSQPCFCQGMEAQGTVIGSRSHDQGWQNGAQSSSADHALLLTPILPQ